MDIGHYRRFPLPADIPQLTKMSPIDMHIPAVKRVRVNCVVHDIVGNGANIVANVTEQECAAFTATRTATTKIRDQLAPQHDVTCKLVSRRPTAAKSRAS